jgi:hypothetical protein
MIKLSSDPAVAEQEVEAVIFYLTALGYIDSEFDLTEKSFVRSFLRQLVTERVDSQGPMDPEIRFEQIERQHEHYVELFQQVDHQVKEMFSEAVSAEEDTTAFVLSQLTVRCYELLEGLSDDNQQQLLQTVDELIHADGVVHPEEIKFRNALAGLLGRDTLEDEGLSPAAPVAIAKPVDLPPSETDHPFFKGFEHHYSTDPQQIRAQIDADLRLLDQAEAKWDEQRATGDGRLSPAKTVADLQGSSFLDGHVYAVPPASLRTANQTPRDYELIVLGDLHGCYSCLKGAVMQSQFMEKVRAYRQDPENNPEVKLVLLGDYIDRGRFSFNGVLRAVLKLFLAVPEHVFLLRGNHEYYIRYEGKIYGGVKPADAIASLQPLLPDEVFERYLRFFESIPNVLLYDNLFFVHGGIPRDQLIRDRWKGLATLNDPDMRFQMLWSDPSRADVIPDDLQRSSARFAFGRVQFHNFMAKLGCSLLVRGHEKVNAGFKDHYPRDDLRLLTVFSAGGVANDDLPSDSNYRDVRPMALTISRKNGETSVTPWAIDYRSYQDPARNAFFRTDEDLATQDT